MEKPVEHSVFDSNRCSKWWKGGLAMGAASTEIKKIESATPAAEDVIFEYLNVAVQRKGVA